MKGFGRWLAETRGGRLVFRLVALGFIAGLAFLLVHQEVGRQTREITRRVQVIESADPCVTLSRAAEGGAGNKTMNRLARACTGFLDGLGPLISQRLACDILETGAYPCPRPGSVAAAEQRQGGDVSKPAPAAGQLTEPAPAGSKGGAESPKDGDDPPAPDKPGHPPASPSPGSGNSPALPSPGSAPPTPLPDAEKGSAQDPPGLVKEVVGGVGETVKEAGCALAKPLLKGC